MYASAVVSLKNANITSSCSFVINFFNTIEWFKWEKGSEAIPVHCLAWPWCPRAPNTILSFPATSEDLQSAWCGTYGCTLQVSSEFLSKHLMSILMFSTADKNSLFFQRDFWVCQRKRWLHCKFATWEQHCQLVSTRIISLVCARGIHFRTC